MPKIVTVVGTRPELIRLTRIIRVLDSSIEHILVHTGQNSDYNLNGIFFKELRIREPDYLLDVDNTTLAKCFGDILVKTEEIFKKEKPDGLLILGDTNSSITALIAKRMGIPIFHMEAGHRSFDLNVPEEINRKVVDHLADFNLVYTEHARRNLLAEGVHPRFIYLTGSPMKEVLDFYNEDILNSKVLSNLNLEQNDYILVSIHREENTDNIVKLEKVLKSLSEVGTHFNKKIILSTHPRTRNRLSKSSLTREIDNINFLKPFGFFNYIKLQMNSFCTISDSGTISEESSILDFIGITLRNSIERPEALDNGSIAIVNENKDIIIDVINSRVKNNFKKSIPNSYLIDNTSNRVLNLILSTVPIANNWLNRTKSYRSDWD